MAKWYFLGEAEHILALKGVRGDLDTVSEALDGTDLADATVKRELQVRGWRTSERVWEDGNYNYDGFKDGVALEAIGPGTSNGRAITYGFVKMELGRQKPDRVEAGVLIVSTRPRGPDKKSHFDEAVEFAQRLRQADMLRIPVAVLGIDTRKRRTR